MDPKSIVQKSFPYLAAIVIFLAIAFFYCSPVFEGKVVHQTDVTQAVGMQKEMQDYHEKTGSYTLWTNSMFGGMPTYQVGKAGVPDYNIFTFFDEVIRFNLPQFSVDIIFLYFVGFFILLLAFGISPWLSIVGAIAFGFSSYNIIYIVAGHVNQALVIGTMPIIIGGFYLVYNKKYILGSIVSILGLGVNIRFNHPQMTYYLILLLFTFFIVKLVYAIKEKEIKAFLIATLILGGSYFLALIPNIGDLYSTYQYSKDTIRGKSELTSDMNNKSSGLDKDYAFSWSYDKMETFTLIIPNFKGGGSSKLSENSAFYKALTSNGVPSNVAKQYASQAPTYWGEQAFTYGPFYFGAVICFFFILAIYIIDKKLKWWIVSITVLSILLSWGSHFEWFSDLFYYYVPLYNKFRAVSSILVLASIVFPLMAMLGIKEIYSAKIPKKQLLKYIKNAFFITGGITAFFLILGGSIFDFSTPNDATYKTSEYPGWFLAAILDDRKNLFRMDALRSLIFIALSAGVVWLYIKEHLKAKYFIIVLAALILIDMWGVDKRYLNNDDFASRKRAREIAPTNADLQILQDKDPDYRVFNLTANPFTETHTSYFHKSLGGYHGAKLRRYNELIEHCLSKQNMDVINMLNTKYFITPGKNNEPVAQQNPGAMGNAWFVSKLKVVNNADEEIAALDHFGPSHTAIIDKRFVEKLPPLSTLEMDSVPQSSEIRLTNYKPNDLSYKSSSAHDLFAVFSEIYYNDTKGWNAYLDGKKVSHVRVNYVLRGMAVPSGQHFIEFKFEPKAFYTGQRVSLISSVIVGVVLVLLIGFSIYKQSKTLVT